MSGFEALLLGLVQGLTEFLPVSSSGHLEIGKALLGIDPEAGGLMFDVVLHVATVMATLCVLWREVLHLDRRTVVNIVVSMIPIGIVGLCFKDHIEALYAAEDVRRVVVGSCLIATALLLAFAHFAKPGRRTELSPLHAFAIGVAQALAVLPGLSRSGSTIATGLLLGNRRERLAQFSFLMVIPPIMGEALLDVRHASEAVGAQPSLSLAIGFAAAFVSGIVACRWMISLVRKMKLIYFAIYCALMGSLALWIM